MSPLATALLGRALGQRLPLHTWLACVVGAVSVALVFAGSVETSPAATRGCLLACVCTICFSAFLVAGSHFGDVTILPCFPVAGCLMVAVAFAILGSRSGYARPASKADAVLVLLNGLINGLANVLMVVGSQTCPAAEVSLIALLETGLAPVLVYLITLKDEHQEVPDTLTIVAGALIIVVLAAHTLYDAHVASRATAAAAAAIVAPVIDEAKPAPGLLEAGLQGENATGATVLAAAEVVLAPAEHETGMRTLEGRC